MIWRLHLEADKYLSLIAHDLKYFHDHFNGMPLQKDWSPPPIEVSGKSKKIGDFVSWTKTSPVVSERARDALMDTLDGAAQFLRFHELKGNPYFAMNVVKVLNDCLDLGTSEILYAAAEPGLVIAVRKAFFLEARCHDLPPIFKIAAGKSSDPLSDIYVTKAFADIAIEKKLSGFSLADPRESSLEYILERKPQNVVPGIVG